MFYDAFANWFPLFDVVKSSISNVFRLSTSRVLAAGVVGLFVDQ